MKLRIVGRTPAAAAASLGNEAFIEGKAGPEHSILAVSGTVNATKLIDKLGITPEAEFDAIKLVAKREHFLKRKCYSFFTGAKGDSLESQLLSKTNLPDEFDRNIITTARGADMHVRVVTAPLQDYPVIHFHEGGVVTVIPNKRDSTVCFASINPISFEPIKPIAAKYDCDLAKGFTLMLPLPKIKFYEDAFLSGRAGGMSSPFYGVDLALQLKSGYECGKADTLSDYKRAMVKITPDLELQKNIWERVPNLRMFWVDIAMMFSSHIDMKNAETLSKLLSH